MKGRIVQLSLKSRHGRERGLPKGAAPRLAITANGVDSDYNRWRTEEAAGDPAQAVLLLSDETLVELRKEGWPVERGDLGENVTMADLPAGAFRPGVQVRLGAVLLQVTKPCDPCVVLYGLPYVGTDRGPEFLRALRGRRGWFARVIRAGDVTLDTPLELIESPGGRAEATA